MLDDFEYDAWRDDAADTMRDKCKIGTKTLTSSYDPTDITWTYGAEIDCGFNSKMSRESYDGSAATVTDARCRIGLDNLIGGHDRIHLTQRDGDTVSEYYSIIGEPRRGISAYVLHLKRLVGNSTT